MEFTLLAVIFFSLAAAENASKKINNPIRNQNSLIKNMEYGLYMLQNMNTSVDPCDNFYEFACGNFDDPSYPANRSKYYGKANDDMASRMKHLMTDSRRSFKIEPFKYISDFYYSCENINNYHRYINEDHTEFLNKIISKLGGWPVLEGDKWNESDFNWIKYGEKLISIGYNLMGFYGVSLEFDDSVAYVIISLIPPKTKFLNDESLIAYYDYMNNVAKFLGADENRIEDLMLSLKFEDDIRAIYYDNKKDENNKPLEITVKEMIEKWPSIDWIKLLNSVMNPLVKFTNETIVHVRYPNFTTEFEKLLNNTPKSVQANYAIWNFIESAIPYINSKTLWNYRQTYMKINNSSYSTEKSQFDCIALVKSELGMLLHAYYLREYPVDERTRSEVHTIYSNVKNKFIEILNSSKWLDSNAKIEIIDKINSIETVIGYPDELLNDNELKNYFKGLEITRDNFLKNHLNASSFIRKKQLFSLFNNTNSVKNGLDLFIFIYTLPNNAVYDGSHNVISVAVELLRNYFFDVDRFNYLNYGVVGETIGHELSHTVDDEERVIKKTGLKYKWSDLSNDEYKKQETCIIDQYTKYFANNKITQISPDQIPMDFYDIEYLLINFLSQLNAKKYLSENIADNIAIKVAYLAYQDWVAKNGHEPNLFGLPYTPNQLFWISFANQWCKSKSLLSKINVKASHAPNDKRVIGPLSNSIEFSKDFNCPVGSNMNPSNKCIFF